MQPFLAILAEEESASVMMSPAFFSEELGVTRLNQPWQCGHLFCKRELRFLILLYFVSSSVKLMTDSLSLSLSD